MRPTPDMIAKAMADRNAHHDFVTQCKSAQMMEGQDVENWTKLEWGRWRLQVRAECAAAGSALAEFRRKAVQNAKATKPQAKPKTKVKRFTRARAIAAKVRAKAILRRHAAEEYEKAEDKLARSGGVAHYGSRW